MYLSICVVFVCTHDDRSRPVILLCRACFLFLHTIFGFHFSHTHTHVLCLCATTRIRCLVFHDMDGFCMVGLGCVLCRFLCWSVFFGLWQSCVWLPAKARHRCQCVFYFECHCIQRPLPSSQCSSVLSLRSRATVI